MNIFSQMIQIGTAGLPERDARKVRLINLLTMITASVSFIYLLFYIYLKSTIPILVNVTAVACYLATFRITLKKNYRFAKIWIFLSHMIHLFLLTMGVFTNDTGFQFYYFAVIALLFLLFEYNEMLDKIVLSLIAVGLFFVCEMVEVSDPYIILTPVLNRVLYLSTILIVFLGILLVIFLFTYDIHRHEQEQAGLIQELKKALSEVKTLQGFLPICASCKKIRDDKGYWNQIESYIRERSDAEFSHSICPECAGKLYPELDLFDEET